MSKVYGLYKNKTFFQKTLTFPEDVTLADTARSLITGLLTGAAQRLKYDRICAHSFFTDIDLDNIRHSKG